MTTILEFLYNMSHSLLFGARSLFLNLWYMFEPAAATAYRERAYFFFVVIILLMSFWVFPKLIRAVKGR